MAHSEPSPFAGELAYLTNGTKVLVIDWLDRAGGRERLQHWLQIMEDRGLVKPPPDDDEALLVNLDGNVEKIVHVSEITRKHVPDSGPRYPDASVTVEAVYMPTLALCKKALSALIEAGISYGEIQMYLDEFTAAINLGEQLDVLRKWMVVKFVNLRLMSGRTATQAWLDDSGMYLYSGAVAAKRRAAGHTTKSGVAVWGGAGSGIEWHPGFTMEQFVDAYSTPR